MHVYAYGWLAACTLLPGGTMLCKIGRGYSSKTSLWIACGSRERQTQTLVAARSGRDQSHRSTTHGNLIRAKRRVASSRAGARARIRWFEKHGGEDSQSRIPRWPIAGSSGSSAVAAFRLRSDLAVCTCRAAQSEGRTIIDHVGGQDRHEMAGRLRCWGAHCVPASVRKQTHSRC